jgi:hypothetical protein
MEATHGFELGLAAPFFDRLAEAHRGALDGLGGVLPREVLHVRGEVGRRLRDVIELRKKYIIIAC